MQDVPTNARWQLLQGRRPRPPPSGSPSIAHTAPPAPHTHAGKKAAAAAKKGGPGMPVAAIEAIKARAAASRSIAKDVDREFKEADAGPDPRLQAFRQSKMLEALFEIYFRWGPGRGSDRAAVGKGAGRFGGQSRAEARGLSLHR